MAEGVLSNIAAKILEVLGSQVFQEITLAAGVKDEIHKLKDTVSTIEAVLLDAEEQHSNNNRQVTQWLRRLKDAFYDADDLLDDFSTELKQREEMAANKITKEVRIFFSNSNQIAYSLKMGHKIKTMRERLDKIADDRKFHLDERSVKITERETYSYVNFEKVIGRDNDKNEIIQLLLDSTNDVKNVSVIPIVGIGGLGKTTLAQLVFNDEKVVNHFQLKMWVCLSDNFDVKMIVEKIIKSATDTAPGNLELDQLQKILRREINGKKYLLVLDDNWNEDHNKWSELEDLLMNGARGSKILITTRNEGVVKATCTQIPSYTLKGLPEGESWNLFTKMAFKHGKEPMDSRLVAIGKEIVVKCLGVPLTLKTIGSLLYSKTTVNDWLQFKDNEMSKIGQNTEILDILKLSYNHLSSNLKQCFACCALFPKDDYIKKQNLIYFWMAQGFIQSSNNNQPLEDIGNDYFNNLLSRSFFQDPKYDEFDNIMECKMHDLMHDLAKSVARSECTLAAMDGKDFNESARYVSFEKSNVTSWKIPPILFRANHIRAISFPFHYPSESNFKKMLSSFKSLRTLNLSRAGVEKLPRSIGKLKHLRYLNLSCNFYLKKLPGSISRLQNLETLDLSGCSLKELPRDITKIVSLKHLIIDTFPDIPYGFGLLTALQTLPIFKVRETNQSSYSHKNLQLSELQGLNNLRGNLEIINLQHVINSASPRLTILEEKQYLQSLTLEWEVYEVDDWSANSGIDEKWLEGLKPHQNLEKLTISNFGGVKLSGWLSFITNITSITLIGCKRCRHIPPLGELPFLMRLSLEYLDALEYISETRSNHSSSTPSMTFFQSLKKLKLFDCPKLKGWWRRDDDGATTQITELPWFPCLSLLEIDNCLNLTSMPLFPSAEELNLMQTSSKPLQQTMMSMNRAATSTSSSNYGPLSKLKSLTVSTSHDLDSLPEEGVRNFISLTSITISNCKQCQHIPSLDELPSLERLSLARLDALEYISETRSNNSSSTPSTTFFQSLKKLKLVDCPKLKGWWRRDDDGATTQITELPWFPCLSKLEINNCPNLTSMPLYPSAEKLDLMQASSKPLQQMMMLINRAATSTSFSNYVPLSKLKFLSICLIEDLKYLPEEGLRNLTSLVGMNIRSCPRFSQLSRGIGYLNCLEILTIEDCWDLLMDDEDMQWQGLRSLHSLRFANLPKLVSLPKGLQYVTTLESLNIWRCSNLKELPGWICNFRSLKLLQVSDCPQLFDGYRNYITHIPEIYIDGRRYQMNTDEGSSSLTVAGDEK